jgi:hypothetical protein
MWSPEQVGDVFNTSTSAAPSSHSSFDFSLPQAPSEPNHHSHHHPRIHHQQDSYQMSTVDVFAPPPAVTQTRSDCIECGHLLRQLGESLDALDKVQIENRTLKENVNQLSCSNRCNMLFTAQDCDEYEQELLRSFQMVKERKVNLLSVVVCLYLSCVVCSQ